MKITIEEIKQIKDDLHVLGKWQLADMFIDYVNENDVKDELLGLYRTLDSKCDYLTVSQTNEIENRINQLEEQLK
jgi:hypothetical protein